MGPKPTTSPCYLKGYRRRNLVVKSTEADKRKSNATAKTRAKVGNFGIKLDTEPVLAYSNPDAPLS